VHETERLADHMGVLVDGELHAQFPVSELQRMLVRYRAEVRTAGRVVEDLNGSVVRRAGRAGARSSGTVWGKERDVRERLTAAGASVREASALSLEEATVSLLGAKGVADGR
jgi:hypothetical protein